MKIPALAMFSRYGDIVHVDTRGVQVPSCLCALPDASPRRMDPNGRVYVLIDPRSGDIRYVGETSDPVARLRAHSSVTTKRCARRDWVESLRHDFLCPVMFVVGRGGRPEEAVALAHVLATGADVLNSGGGNEMIRARAIKVSDAAQGELQCFAESIRSIGWEDAIRKALPPREAFLAALDARLVELSFDSTARRNIDGYRWQNA